MNEGEVRVHVGDGVGEKEGLGIGDTVWLPLALADFVALADSEAVGPDAENDIVLRVGLTLEECDTEGENVAVVVPVPVEVAWSLAESEGVWLDVTEDVGEGLRDREKVLVAVKDAENDTEGLRDADCDGDTVLDPLKVGVREGEAVLVHVKEVTEADGLLVTVLERDSDREDVPENVRVRGGDALLVADAEKLCDIEALAVGELVAVNKRDAEAELVALAVPVWLAVAVVVTVAVGDIGEGVRVAEVAVSEGGDAVMVVVEVREADTVEEGVKLGERMQEADPVSVGDSDRDLGLVSESVMEGEAEAVRSELPVWLSEAVREAVKDLVLGDCEAVGDGVVAVACESVGDAEGEPEGVVVQLPDSVGALETVAERV